MRINFILSSLALASSVYAEHASSSQLRGALEQLTAKHHGGSALLDASTDVIPSSSTKADPSPAKANGQDSDEKEQIFHFFPDDKEEMDEEEGEDEDGRRRNNRGSISVKYRSNNRGRGNGGVITWSGEGRRGNSRSGARYVNGNGRRGRNGNRIDDSFSRSGGKRNGAQKRQTNRDNRRTRDNPDRGQGAERRERQRKYDQSRSRGKACADPSQPGCGNRNFDRNREKKREVVCNRSGRNCNHGRSAISPNEDVNNKNRGCVRGCEDSNQDTRRCVERKCSADSLAIFLAQE